MAKIKELWEEYIAGVPGFCDAIETPPTVPGDSDVEYRTFTESLPDDVTEQLEEFPKQPDEIAWHKAIEHQWCLCEMPEGDFPRVFVFPNLARLAAAIAKREGNEMAVWPMFGIPLRMTQSVPNPKRDGSRIRYLLLPNQLAAIVGEGEEFQLIDQSLLPDNLDIQEEGWLGDTELLRDQNYFMEGYVEENQFSADPDMNDDDDEDSNYV